MKFTNFKKAMLAVGFFVLVVGFQNCGQQFTSIEQLGKVSAESVKEADPLDILLFNINKSIITSGESAELTFKISGAKQAILSPGDIDVLGKTSLLVQPVQNTDYTLTVKNDTASISRKISIQVNAPLAVISKFTASSTNINAGDSVTLDWTVGGATQVLLDPGNMVVTGNSVTLKPAATTVYTLKAFNSMNMAVTKSVTVMVANLPPEMPKILTLTANPASIMMGKNTTISWTTQSAVSLKLDPGNIDMTGKTSQVVQPSATTVYTLTATNTAGSVTQQVTVTVTPLVAPPKINSFLSSSLVLYDTETANLTWSVTGATMLKINPLGTDVTNMASLNVAPKANTTYSLVASNAGGDVTASVSIIYIPPWVISPAISLVENSGSTVDLSLTLPAGVKRGGTFVVSSTGSALPSGMILSAAGILSVGNAAVGDTLNVVFEYTEP